MKSYNKIINVSFKSANRYTQDVTFTNLRSYNPDGISDLAQTLTHTYPVKMSYKDDSNLKFNFKNTTYIYNRLPISAIIGLQAALDEKADISSLALVAFTGMWDDLGFRLPQIIDCGTSTEVIDVSGQD